MVAPALAIEAVGRKTPPGILAGIVGIEKKAFPKHESLVDYIMKEATTTGNTFLVALDGDDVVGYVLFSRNSVCGHIGKLAVAAHRRRQGIGRHLMQVAIQRMRSAMCISLHVGVERDYAFALYASLGFTVQHTRKDYYKVGRDAHFMELQADNFAAALASN
ncbi:ribosomal-protein-alanine acetyltransferase [Achlya hypogyna]|uniref:Ribosomal-protein-alanine acetyltransferase n=1 Tax=Achlya hypogyna TaxID=1202772 RepID=A0A1V9ZP23_ACHHY|nr:ribosomal-protein-alanine acetyltransferase [Achlya hypogyna]